MNLCSGSLFVHTLALAYYSIMKSTNGLLPTLILSEVVRDFYIF